MSEDSFYRYFMVGAVLILSALLMVLVGFLFAALWSLGFFTFTKIVCGVLGFCWLVNKIANIKLVRKWTDSL